MNFRDKTILVVGGTGFIGYFLIKKLLKLKGKVFSLSISKPKKCRKLIKVNYLYANIKNFSHLNKIFKGKKIDYVINCGGYVEHKKKMEVYDSHYKGNKNMYKIFKNKNLKKYIQIGSSLEYGKAKVPHKEIYKCKPIGIYGQTKLKTTKFLLDKFCNYNFPVVIIRFYQVYGPNQDFNRFIPQLLRSSIKKKKFFTSEGKQSRDFLFIEDAIDAIILALLKKESSGQILNIGYGKGIKLKKIMNKVKIMNNYLNPDYGKIKMRKDEELTIYPNISKSKKILGWFPKISINKGLELTNKYYLKKFK